VCVWCTVRNETIYDFMPEPNYGFMKEPKHVARFGQLIID
jgi:hypothetical protein